ncbi:uncharacterized protein LOC123907070 [Trifolium pratense]|nr:uncharacterized protein LOC123907070 [Trifolium pratense]
MAWYRKGKLVFDGFHRLAQSRVSSQNSILKPSSRISSSGYFNLGSKGTIFNGFSSFSSISKRLETKGFEVNKNFRRFYYVDPRNVKHFATRGPKGWFQNPRNIMIVVVVGSGVFITVCFGNMETVPYTKRTHVILISNKLERMIGESEFEKIKVAFNGKLLPAMHPESVRVTMIANDIVNALKRGLSQENENVWSDLGYASGNTMMSEEHGRETLNALTENEGNVEGNWHQEDLVLDDKWVQKSRKKGEKRGSKPYTLHLDQFNWEILVVNEPVVNAFCLPGGKIVVFTGLLEHFRSDAEIATIIGHEVAHAVARHSAEGITKNLWFFILQLILYQFVTPDVVHTMSSLFLRLPFSRRMEIEADYIGLLLIASAGYDPRMAPKVYEKLGKITGGSSMVQNYLSTHPSGKKRAELLAQAQVMEEAVTIYKNVRSGRGVEGFL